MVFGKKKTKKENKEIEQTVNVEAQSQDNVGAKPVKRANETLASVVKESILGPAIDIMRKNVLFELPNEHGYLILVLDVDDESFGGLSAKNKNDADKGSIIELITSDQIQVFATEDLIKAEKLGIIPTEETLECMADFGLLRNAKYYWGLVQEDEVGVQLDIIKEAKYSDARDINSGKSTLAKKLPKLYAWANGEDEVSESKSEPVCDVVEEVAEEVSEDTSGEFNNDWDDSFLDNPTTEETEFADPTATIADEFAPSPLSSAEEAAAGALTGEIDFAEEVYEDETDGEEGEVVYDARSELSEEVLDALPAYTEYEDVNRSREVTEEEVRDSVLRRFSYENMDFDVDFDTFDKMFSPETIGLDYSTVTPNDELGVWLKDQIDIMCTEANVVLDNTRRDNFNNLRQSYANRMNEAIAQIINHVSKPESDFSIMLDKVEKVYNNEVDSINAKVADRTKVIEEKHVEAADAVAEAAAAKARADFLENNRLIHEQQLERVRADEMAEIEKERDRMKSKIHATRSKEAQILFDQLTSKVLKGLSERDAQLRAEEAKLRGEYIAKINKFIDDNRKNDIAQTQAQLDTLARGQELEEVVKKSEEDRNALIAQHDSAIAALKVQVDNEKARLADEIKSRDAYWEDKLSLERDRSKQSDELIKSMSSQIEQTRESVAREYESRLNALEADKKSYQDELARNDKLHAQSNRTMMLLIVVLVIAALIVGAFGSKVLDHYTGATGFINLIDSINFFPNLL